MLTLLSPLHASLTVIALFILYLVYLLVIKPVTLIRYYERQGALGEYYPILGGYGKRVNEANITGDWLSFYKKDIQNSKGAHKLFATNILGNAFLFLVDPDLIKDFISNQEKNYKKAEEFIDLDKFFLGTGVATSEGEVWKKHRKIVSSAFHFDFIKSTVPIIEQVTQEVFDAVAKENMSSVDIMDVHAEDYRGDHRKIILSEIVSQQSPIMASLCLRLLQRQRQLSPLSNRRSGRTCLV